MSLPTWQKLHSNYNKHYVKLVIRRGFLERLSKAKYINRAKTTKVTKKLKLTPINEYTEFIILENLEFTQLLEDLKINNHQGTKP